MSHATKYDPPIEVDDTGQFSRGNKLRYRQMEVCHINGNMISDSFNLIMSQNAGIRFNGLQTVTQAVRLDSWHVLQMQP